MVQAYIIPPAEAMSEYISRIIGPDNIGDGAGIMTSIPQDLKKQKQSLQVFEETFWQKRY